MIDKDGWVHCPICKSKTKTKINEDTFLKNFPLFCPKCRNESIIDIKDRKLKLSIR